MFTYVKFFFLFLALEEARCDPSADVTYYKKLALNFFKNSSKWQSPVDSKRFFQFANEEPVDWGTYDFVVVGTGPAGSVLTNRLTESGKFKILVLEAGGFENDFTDIPGMAPYLTRSDFNWGYKTIPQKNACLGMEGRQCHYHRGKAVGGSSVTNFMMYIRGNKQDFDRWGANNPGWSYEEVLPLFVKSERAHLDDEAVGYHGHEGPLSVEHAHYYPNVTQTFLDAVQETGRKLLDYNGEDQMGFSRLQTLTINGRRCSGGKAFVRPALQRPNLELLDNALALKVLIKDRRAYGVEFSRAGRKYRALASREVVLSAGSINSAQLLMLSGLGPEQHLHELGIPVVHDLPVGEELNDHPVFMGLPFATNLTARTPSLTELFREFLGSTGILTTAGAVSAIGFGSPRAKSSNPSLEYFFASAAIDQITPVAYNFFKLTKEAWEAVAGPNKGRYVWCIVPMLMHPKSRGRLWLKTSDPLDYPLIDSNLYSDAEDDDMAEMLSGVRDIFEMSKTAAFRGVGSEYLGEPVPACAGLERLSDEYWRCTIKQYTYPILHAVSTCKMGPAADRSAVVDNRLRVHGVAALRVADASVMPFSIASHPTACVYMIGEKAAELIRSEHDDF